jgi:hypothetical protein
MKRLFYSFWIFLLFSFSALAQNEGISFQGLARNAAGEVLVSQTISLRLSILLGSESGTVAYTETRQTTTNPQGIFAVVLGDNTALTKSTNFSTIDWSTAQKFIKVEMDPNAGTNFTAMGTTKLQAVPFAYYAFGIDAENVDGVLPVSSGGTGVASISELKINLGVDQVNNTSDANKPISAATQDALNTKVDKENGKGLSSNDYTTAEKIKLAAITGNVAGPQGPAGLPGATGPQGLQGLQGPAGATGATGPVGATGLQGPIGLTGPQGQTGATGAQGPIGLTGPAGATGPQGPIGLTGPAGNDGAVGPQGATGAQGPIGLTGPAGATGPQGPIGLTGPAGNDGAVGPQGATGAQGPIGATGPAGAAGVNGVAGANGLDGKTVLNGTTDPGSSTGENGDFYINTTSNKIFGPKASGVWPAGVSLIGIASVGAISGTSTANGASITGGELKLAPADGTSGGIVTISAQTFAGAKTFSSDLTVNGVTVGKGQANITDNTAFGTSALAAASTSGGYNSAFGYQALQANTTGGSSNSAFGTKALAANTTGNTNTALGANSLLRNVSGHNNISVNGALIFNESGNYNIGIGAGALQGNKIGSTNIAIGREAGFHLNSYNSGAGAGGGNIFVGYQAGISRNRGSFNTAIGQQSLYSFTTAFYDYSNAVAIGYQSGFTNTTNNNTYLGSFADVDYTTNSSITNATALGYQAKVIASNTIQLGNTAVTNVKTSGTLTAGTVTYPNTHGTANQVLSTTGSGTLAWTTPSAGSGSGVAAVGTIGSSPNGNGASISGTTLNLQPADATNGGVVTTSAQTFGGAKTFNADISVNGIKIGRRTDPGYGMLATSFGVGALDSYVVGAYGATAFGNNALQANTSGAYNNAFGIGTLASLTTGSGNTAIGSFASNETSNASNNVIIGHEAGRYLNTDDNTIIGYRAGQTCCTTNSTNIKNTYIGSGSGNGTTGSNNVIIGSYGGGNFNNNIILADGAGTWRYHWNGTTNNFNGTVSSSGSNLTSDLRLKSKIVPLTTSLATIMQLNPVHYVKKESLASTTYTLEENGFIAQEIQKILPYLVQEGTDKDKLLSLNYVSLIPLLTKAIQEQQAQIEELQSYKTAISSLQKELEEIKKLLKGQEK